MNSSSRLPREPTDEWSRLCLPLLEWVRNNEADLGWEGTKYLTEIGYIADALEFAPADLDRALQRLLDEGYLTAAPDSSTGESIHRSIDGLETHFVMGLRLSGGGQRIVGEWPTEDVYERLLELLDSHIETEHNRGRRRGLKKLRRAVTSVGSKVSTSFVSELLLDVIKAV